MYSTNRRRYYLSGQRFGEMSPSSSEERVFLAKKNQRFAKKCLQTGLYWAIIVRRGNTAAKTNHTFRDFPSQCRLVGTDTTGCGSRRIFCPNFSAKNLEIQKVFLRFSNLNLVQNLSLTALADFFRGSIESTSCCTAHVPRNRFPQNARCGIARREMRPIPP